jgi:hypothetical protein
MSTGLSREYKVTGVRQQEALAQRQLETLSPVSIQSGQPHLRSDFFFFFFLRVPNPEVF